MKTSLILITALLAGSVAFADDVAPAAQPEPARNEGLMKDFDTLGGNDVLLDKARELNPEERVSIVQDRIVGLRNRVEISPEFTSVLGGDPYNHTNGFALNAYYHINPRWALGAKYEYDTNSLRPEANNLIQQAQNESDRNLIPDIDFPKSEALALVNWYPIYGKMNLHDLGVVHFDIYAVGGAGQVALRSGNTSTYTAGGGFAFWFSQHLSARLEVRYQTYTAQHEASGPEKMNLTVGGLQVGYLL